MPISTIDAERVRMAVSQAVSDDIDPVAAVIKVLDNMRNETAITDPSQFADAKIGYKGSDHWLSAQLSEDLPQFLQDEALDHLAQALRMTFPASTWDDSVESTARRMMSFWHEYIPKDEIDFKFTTFDAAKGQVIFIGDIEFSSLCVHHMLPFTGKVHIAYKAHDRQVGLSKIPRLVRFWSQRPQIQEQLTEQLVTDIKERVATQDVMVMIEARHTCVCARGARAHNGVMRTSLPAGLFLISDMARAEFFSLLARNGV